MKTTLIEHETLYDRVVSAILDGGEIGFAQSTLEGPRGAVSDPALFAAVWPIRNRSSYGLEVVPISTQSLERVSLDTLVAKILSLRVGDQPNGKDLTCYQPFEPDEDLAGIWLYDATRDAAESCLPLMFLTFEYLIRCDSDLEDDEELRVTFHYPASGSPHFFLGVYKSLVRLEYLSKIVSNN